ncbi:MAG: 5'-nucleotidase C-terminal domain-containing protein [Acidobacteriota bacterium]
MNKINLKLITLFLLIFVFTGNSLFSDSVKKEEKLTIFHLNDIHGNLKNMGKIAKLVEAERRVNRNVFLVNAGDSFSGNPIVDQFEPKGEPLLILMNKLKYDVAVLGNHDFDYGQEILKNFIKRAKFPMILANVKSGKKDFPQPPPFKIFKTKEGKKIVFLGLVQIEKDTRLPSTLPERVEGLTFYDGIETAKKYKYLKKENDVFIALSHLGIQDDEKLANEVGDLDLIIGGHSHTLIDTPHEINGVRIVQAGSKASHLGRVDITLLGEKITGINTKVINLKTVNTVDDEVETIVKDFNRNPLMNRVLTVLKRPVSGRRKLGLLVTDALREKLGLDVVFYNRGGIRINNLKGEVKLKDIYAMHPFGNYIVEIKMDTGEIKDLIKNDFQGHHGIDIISSGLSYRVTRDLVGKVISIDLFDVDGYKIEDNREFRVGLNNYIVSSYKFRHKDPGKPGNLTTVEIVLDFFKNLEHSPDYRNVVRAEEKIIYKGNFNKIGKTNVKIYTSHRKFYENSTSGNLAADAVKKYSGADIATFPTRLLKYGLVINSGLPFFREAIDNLYLFAKRSKIVTGEMSGSDLKEFVLRRSRWKNNIDLQVSGMKYRIFFNRGNRVDNIDVTLNDGKKIENSRIYKISFFEYDFNKYYKISNKVKNLKVLNRNFEEILAEYIKKKGLIGEEVTEKRVILINRENNRRIR